jgi:diguanylate cyclase (GGDEF)-like protein
MVIFIAFALIMTLAVGRFCQRRKPLAISHQPHQSTASRLTHAAVLNRHVFDRRLDARLTTDAAGALLLIDVRHLKRIYDTLGCRVGDAVAENLSTYLLDIAIRYQGILARMDGHEFALYLQQVSAHTAHRVANTIVTHLDTPLTLNRFTLRIPATIGIAAFHEKVPGSATLLAQADTALQRAKQLGIGVATYDPTTDAAILPITVETEFYQALRVNSPTLSLVYQPIINPRTGTVLAMEALFRWKNTYSMTTEPLVKIAESSGFIEHLDRWVIARALQEVSWWRSSAVALALNLSVCTLRNPGLVPYIERVLQATAFPATQLIFEITESAALEKHETGVKTLLALRQMGCKVYLDDFGSGYATFARIKQLPLDGIKVDQQFIKGIGMNRQDEAILRGLSTFARAAGLPLIAEGVETGAQAQWLKQNEFNGLQGYYIGRPGLAPQIPEMSRTVKEDIDLTLRSKATTIGVSISS